MRLINCLLAVCVLSLIACSVGSAPATPLELAIAAIRDHRLTELSVECLAFVEDTTARDDAKIYFDVRERHNEGCGGDPQTSPLLFIIRVDSASGKIETTQGSIDGTYRVLPNLD
jgi:hypothetical protein